MLTLALMLARMHFPAAREMAVIGQQFPFDMPKFKALRLTFAEGIKMLQESGYPNVRPGGGEGGLGRLKGGGGRGRQGGKGGWGGWRTWRACAHAPFYAELTRTLTRIHMQCPALPPQLDPMGDLNTEAERALGALVKAKYDTDFYVLHR